MNRVIIRPETEQDVAGIDTVTRAAFGGSDEAVLIHALRRDLLNVISLVATEDGAVVGHILFSRAFIQTDEGSSVPAVALAPMAVAPGRQRSGIGSALVRAGLEQCRLAGERIVVVVGHPDFYPRFGFTHALTADLRSEYHSPAFMAVELAPGALHGISGEVRYSQPFSAFD